ncbi:MAG: hypothetical protein MPK09_05705 [Gammaproteobacteria bacterium]|nr:hypothetical protein [Gammaproteobacteria bacterium]
MLQLIKDARQKQKPWIDSRFESMRSLQIDNRGAVGEHFVLYLLESIGKKCVHNDALDREKKQWDIHVPDDHVKLEVKTATLTAGTKAFQHESIEKDRSWNALVLLDIAPDEIYISCISKKDLDWKSMHRRANSIFYKYDVKLNNLAGKNELRKIRDFEEKYNAMLENI